MCRYSFSCSGITVTSYPLLLQVLYQIKQVNQILVRKQKSAFLVDGDWEGSGLGTSLHKAASVGAVQRYNALYGPLPSLEIAQAVVVALPGTFPTPRLLSLWAQPCAISMRCPCLDAAKLKCLL